MKVYPLHEATLNADIEAVSALLKVDIPLNELDQYGHTALHRAVFGGYEDIGRVLLEAGADANVFSADGVTPKWRARDFGLVGMEELLAQYGG